MEMKIMQKYKTKAKDSFKTKKNLFLFSLIINGHEEFNDDSFHNFIISNELVNIYSTEYWQQPIEYKINGFSINEIYNSITKLEKSNYHLLKKLESEYIESFHIIFPESEFENLLCANSCHYCEISVAEIVALSEKKILYKKNFRGWSLEIDRLNSNYEYTPANCVMACYWCNNAKTDEFSELEFMPVGKVIKSIWKNRLK